MSKKEEKIAKNEDLENENVKLKEKFESILAKIKKMSDAIELHTNVKNAVSEEKVDNNYLKYIENALEDKFFSDAKFDKIKSKVLLEVVCPDLVDIKKFDIEKLEIEEIGNHFEEQENYIDRICIYDGKFISLFGINEEIPEKVIKYEQSKFCRVDMIEAICEKLEQGRTANLIQYDEYYLVTDEENIKVFKEKKVTDLLKVEETVFDKIKNKLISIFTKKVFQKKKCLPNIELVYDSNPNRLKDFKHTSKIDAKNRMKVLLKSEREVIKSAN